MRSFVCLAIALAGCGASRFRTEHVGVVSFGNGESVPLARGNYQLAMRFHVPRAQIVEWTLACPSVERSGIVGETFDNYRTRRLAELQRMVEQDRRRLATVTDAIAGQAGAVVQVEAPSTRVRAEARAPSGEVVAEQAIAPIHELPYGDVGAGTYTAMVNVQTMQDGACTLTTRAIDHIAGSIAVDRVRDLHAEEQERVAAQQARAIDARGQLRARLVAFGADEHARERRLAEQARLREVERQRRAALAAEQEARREAERVARVKREEEERLRLEAEARLKWEAEAPERARRARLEAERQAKLEAERIARENERRAREAKEAEERRVRMAIVEKERLERIRIIEEERRTRLVIIERQRAEVLRVRGLYAAWLVGTCGADPHRLARLELERVERMRRIEIERIERERRIEIERIERERRIEIARVERERRIQIENERVARERMEREQRERQLALSARMQLTGYLVTAGARPRPPRPSMIVENAGTAPFDGARWEAGTWVWSQAAWQWQWRKGGWVDSTQFGDTGGEAVVRTHVRETTIVREPAVVETVDAPPPAPAATAVSTDATVTVPTGITVKLPASISIDVRPAPRRTKPPRVRDHRRSR